ncbi:MAG: tRNA (N6-threonylcarbamoyladenosine(37)-N6)-methyltransferase TrmO [Candidatus Altiarchaeota archaeon]|nr:tRNA (N6-threonylcarbamoyladenosine(37)-N6)-methyltransferase TrmO [Candidatus Altiarchaeota archaeon]
MNFELKPIGIIHSPYRNLEEIQIQASMSEAIGKIEVFREYEPGLKDIEGFSHIIILYLFHKSEDYKLHVKPYLDTGLRGVFATRFPRRPNPIGLSIVRLIEREKNVLKVEGIDVLDGTPLLDIKPYVPEFDDRKSIEIGWLEGKIKGKHLQTKESAGMNLERLSCPNKIDCPCIKIECISHGVCCECIRFHFKEGGISACLR